MISQFITKHPPAILAVTGMMTVMALSLFPLLRTEVNFKSFFPKGEPALYKYELFVQEMGSSENVLVIAATNEPSVFDSVFLDYFQQFQDQLRAIPNVRSASSILSLDYFTIQPPFIFLRRPYIRPQNAENLARDSLRIFRDFPVTQHFISKDSRVVKIVVQLSDSLTLDGMNTVTQRIDSIAREVSIGEIHLLGRRYMESEYNQLMKREMKTSTILSFAFVILILFLLHRTWAGVLVPLICISVSLIMLYGYMALFNRPLTIMSNLFSTIILIVGISDVMHISSKYAFEMTRSSNPLLAVEKTIREIGFTTFLNSFVTAIGFLSLLTVSMKSQQSFGVDAAVGLMITWANSIFLLPALILQFKLNKTFNRPVFSKQWDKLLRGVLRFTSLYPKQILASFIVVTVVSIVGLFFTNANNFVLTGIPKHDRLQHDYQFFDQRLGGGRTFELMIQTQNGHRISGYTVMQNIQKLEKYLIAEAGVSEIISPVTGIKWANHTVHPEQDWSLPVTREENDFLMTKVKKWEEYLPMKLSDAGDTLGRLHGRIHDIGRLTMDRRIASMEHWINANIDTSLVQFLVTGPDHILDIGHRVRIQNMSWSFMLEIIIVSIIIGIIYKSGILVFLTFISSIIPVILIGGMMGFVGIEMKGNITLIFAVGYVIAVDDTLHFVNRFQLERKKGLAISEALQTTVLHTGRAMVMTSLTLLGGFLILLHSPFGDIYMHGLLISLIILMALITELLLVPVLIHYLF